MLERWLVWNFSSDFFFLHFIACCVRINNKSSPIEIVGHAVCFGHVSHNVLFLIYCCLICCFSRYLSPFIQYIQLAVVPPFFFFNVFCISTFTRCPTMMMNESNKNHKNQYWLTGQSRMSPMLPALRNSWPNEIFWWFCVDKIFCDVKADADT